MSSRTIVIAALLLAAGAAAADPAPSDPPRSDPASALCVKNGATVSSEALPNGQKRSVCVFPNGARIDAGAYFRNKHRTR